MPADLEMLPVLALFLARVVSGYAICLALIGPRITAGSWPRVSLFVIAGLSFAAFAAGAHWMSLVVAGLALLMERARTFSVPVLSSTWWMLPAGLGLWAAHEITYAGGWPPNVAGLAGGIAAGGTLGTMLLGHSYLTARGLSFKPLQFMAKLLFVLLIARALHVGIVLSMAERLGGDWIYISARIAFGLFLPLVFGWMVLQCVKIESNQSATGILYAMTALVGCGELIAAFLQVESGLFV
ncbi:MAG: hypothetical protein V3T86_12360 [Planctomycetota bacterium]